MRNLFVCNSAYQLLVSFFFCELECKDDKNYLLLDEFFYKSIINDYNLKDSFYFKDICCATDKQMEQTTRNCFDLYKIDRVCLFNWGSFCSQYLYNSFNCEFILLDEGLGSYDISRVWVKRGVNVDKVKAVYLLEPDLSLDIQLSTRKLSIEEIIEDHERWIKFISRVNSFFNYSDKQTIPDIIYFDRYFVSENTIPSAFENMFIENLLTVLNEYSFEVKTHPSESRKLSLLRYNGWKDRISFNLTKIPWELYLLNSTKKNSIVIVSINSSPLIMSKMLGELLKIRIDTICLLDMVRPYIAEQETYIEPLINRYNLLHKGNEIYCLTKFVDLKYTLSTLLEPSKKELISTYKENEEYESEWLRHCLRDYSELFGNLIGTVNMYCYRGETCLTEDYQLFFLKNHRIDVEFLGYGSTIECDRLEFEISLGDYELQITEAQLIINGKPIDMEIENSDSINNHLSVRLCETISICDIALCFDFKKPLFNFDYRKYL